MIMLLSCGQTFVSVVLSGQATHYACINTRCLVGVAWVLQLLAAGYIITAAAVFVLVLPRPYVFRLQTEGGCAANYPSRPVGRRYKHLSLSARYTKRGHDI